MFFFWIRWAGSEVALSMTGRQLQQMITARLPSKPGSRIAVQHGSSPLSLDQTLRQQGLAALAGECITMSCVYVRVDLLAASKYLRGEQVEEEEFSLHGLTQIGGVTSVQQLLQLPSSLQHLNLSVDFNDSLRQVSFPSGIKTMTFGNLLDQSFHGVALPAGSCFNQSLDGVALPAGLRTLACGDNFNQSLDGVALPAGLQTLTFGRCFNQSLDRVILPAGLQTLTVGDKFNQRFDHVTLPAGLQTLTFDSSFNQSLHHVTLPAGLQTLKFGDNFNQSLDGVALPAGLQTLTFGSCFDQSLDRVTLPAGLQTLTFGSCFDQSLDRVTLPAGLQTLTFGSCFDQSLDRVTLPAGLQTLTFGSCFDQSLDRVTLPAELQNLTFGSCFDKSLDRVSLPAGLQTLTFGPCFNQKLFRLTLPTGLQTLTVGSGLNKNMRCVTLPADLKTLTFVARFGSNPVFDGVTLPAALQDLSCRRLFFCSANWCSEARRGIISLNPIFGEFPWIEPIEIHQTWNTKSMKSKRVCLFHSDVIWKSCCCFLSFLSVLGYATCTPILGVVPFGSSWRVPLDLHEDMVNGCWEKDLGINLE